MQPDDRDAGLLWRMRRGARDAVALASELTLELLRASSAICHAVEQVGEAAARVSPGFRDAHPELPWRQIIGARNRPAHDYEGTDWEIVWTIATGSLPDLLEKLDRLIPPADLQSLD
jgi:uncharacterized protein with HEPN domain